MNKPIAPDLQPSTSTSTTIAGLPLPAGVTLDLDPLDGGHCVLLAVTGEGRRVEVRLFVPEVEREDWRKVVEVLRGGA